MTTRLKLTTLIEEMDFQSEEYLVLYHSKTGRLVSVSKDILRLTEEEEVDTNQYPEWQHEMIVTAIDIHDNFQDYIGIPSSFDIHEYEIMEDFSMGIEPSHVSAKLCRAIQGKGAFRRFKDLIFELDVEADWYSYKKQRLKQIATEWCNNHGIKYEDDV